MFIIPVLLPELTTTIIISIMIGFFLIFLININIAGNRNVNPWKVVIEHLIIRLVVILLTYFIGKWINKIFNTNS